MGAYIWDNLDTLILFHHQLPVYYVCPYASFSCRIILSIKLFADPVVYNTLGSAQYPVILSNNQAGSDEKFAAIHTAATTYFSVSSPFANMHLPGAYSSSYSSTSSSRIIPPTYFQPSTAASSTVQSTSTSSSWYSPIAEPQS
ncbi:hypothetical protein PM082_020045 [Marasmius tenuissimus]|nr:hypothetical protein PM082_020045 [Marasmius tenuissimus]